MSRPMALGFASALGIVLAAILAPSPAHAAECRDASACPDDDGDGFVSCLCSPGGQPCDCDDRDPLAFPGAPEACDAPKDLNCDGNVRAPCGKGNGCIHSMCAPECIPLDDFGCAPYSACESTLTQRLCVGRDCLAYGCPPGLTCDDTKKCVPTCGADVRCPWGQLCRGNGCVDPCTGVVCSAGETCVGGRCLSSCECPSDACPGDAVCDVSLPVPRCVARACAGVVCPGGAHCDSGTCEDDCARVVCPTKQLCRVVSPQLGPPRGQCVDLCATTPCSLPDVCDWRTGACKPPDYPEGGLGSDGLLRDAASGLDANAVYGGGGCAASDWRGVSAPVGLSGSVAIGLATLFRRRRRRR